MGDEDEGSSLVEVRQEVLERRRRVEHPEPVGLSLGQPVVLETTHQPTFVDPNAAICWSANLQVNLSRSEGMGSFIGRTSGEHFQMQFSGPGFVVVQPDENRSGIGQTGTTQASGPGGALGGLLGGGR